MTHELKILPKYFEDVMTGKKNFEIRKNDRDFKVGDYLLLKEWERGKYTGRQIKKRVQYIYFGNGAFGLSEEYCVLALEEQQTGEWIPVKYRPMTTEERIEITEYYGIEYCDTVNENVFDCPMPEDGQEILISTSWGVVEDVADNDIGGEGFTCYGLETRGDWDGVDAWMPKPEPYKKGEKKDG